MVAFSKIFFAVAAAVSVSAAPSDRFPHGPSKLFEKLKQLPKQWVSNGRADTGATIKAQIALKQTNIKGLQEKLVDISNPDSPNYGKWLSQEEIAAYSAPADGHADAVKAWLESAGITEMSQPSNDWIEFTVPVHQMESLLDTEYEWFTHEDSGIKVPRTTKYSIPEGLHDMIDTITPTTAFYTALTGHSKETTATQGHGQLSKRRLAGCKGDGSITPGCVNEIYNVDYTSSGSQTVASTGMIGVGANHRDYNYFGQSFVPGLRDFKDISVGGAYNNGDGSQIEGNLDTQYIGGISSPNANQYISLGPTGSDAGSFDDALSNLASYLLSAQNPPSVVSTSYGGEEQYYDGNYLDRICNEFMKVGSRGISMFFSSGDRGVGGNGGSCNQGFLAVWPATCPWVTAVGGTQFGGSDNEVVANFYNFNNKVTSPGGGFSWHFDAPNYNRDVTSAYANSLGNSYYGYYNPNGRGYPDISLVSVEYEVVVGGGFQQILGTSASSPAVAALVSVLNDYRQSKGSPTLGFINPLLYSAKAQSALRDVTQGNNFGCGTNGYYASRGWDAASGLGSFDFAKLRAIV